MTQFVRVACAQITSTDDADANRVMIAKAIRDAAAQGAQIIALPENADCLGACGDSFLTKTLVEAGHPTLTLVKGLAQETQAHILLGSIAVRASADDTTTNRSYFFSPEGEIVAYYDKIHLFDSDVDGVRYRESDRYARGEHAVVAPSLWGGIGLSICYDLRFPHLYRALAHAGARILMVPAAFIVPTGQKHWHVLLRARAIETGCFVVAPAQCGQHGNGRESYGHSLIIAPDGSILAEAGIVPTIIMVNLPLVQVDSVRQALPCLQHDRKFILR